MGQACIPVTSQCFDTINEAIAAAEPGDIVRPAPGLHTEAVVIDKDVSLIADGLGDVVLRDTLDGRPILTVAAGVHAEVVNLTFAATVGRVFEAEPGSKLVLSNVHAYSQAVVDAGAIGYADHAEVDLYGVRFVGGVAEYGGQLAMYDGMLLASGTFADGHASDSGGCFATFDSDGVSEEHVIVGTFVGCEADRQGGALYLEHAFTWITASTFDSCTALSGSALHALNPVAVRVTSSVVTRSRASSAFALIGDRSLGATSFHLQDVHVSENLGAAVAADNTTEVALDGLVVTNSDADGEPAVGVVLDKVDDATIRRGLYCGNDSPLGALISADLEADQTLAVTNERFAANTAGVAIDTFGGDSIELTHNEFLFGSGDAAAVNGAHAVTFSDNLVDGMAPQGDLVSLIAVEAIAATNLFWDTPSSPVGGPGAIGFVGDPGLQGWDASRACAAAEDHPAWDVPGAPFAEWYGGGRDAGTIGLDRDGSAPDIGAAGGPEASEALWADSDGDGWPGAYDCPLTGDLLVDAVFHPNAEDHPYDGIDADCDRRSDNDADRDGHDAEDRGGDDCDDASARRHPDAVEVGGNRIDEDCDGSLDGDGDGFEPPDDCDDFDASVYPGLSEDEGSVDRNCDGIADVARPLVKPGCATVPAFPSALLALALATLTRRRRVHGR